MKTKSSAFDYNQDTKVLNELIFSKARLGHDEDILSVLLQQVQKKQFSINSRNVQWNGRTLLHEAAANGNETIIQTLVEKFNADIHCRTYLGKDTPLHLAVSSNHRSCVCMLLNYGADPNMKNKYGRGPLFYARKRSIATLLWTNGAREVSINTFDETNNPKDDDVLITSLGDQEDIQERRQVALFLQSMWEIETEKRTMRELTLHRMKKKEDELENKVQKRKDQLKKSRDTGHRLLQEYHKWRNES